MSPITIFRDNGPQIKKVSGQRLHPLYHTRLGTLTHFPPPLRGRAALPHAIRAGHPQASPSEVPLRWLCLTRPSPPNPAGPLSPQTAVKRVIHGCSTKTLCVPRRLKAHLGAKVRLGRHTIQARLMQHSAWLCIRVTLSHCATPFACYLRDFYSHFFRERRERVWPQHTRNMARWLYVGRGWGYDIMDTCCHWGTTMAPPPPQPTNNRTS